MLPHHGTVYGVILNDRTSVTKLGDTLELPPYKGKPKAPVLYIKPANTIVCSGATVHLPESEVGVEVGATVGIVIGQAASKLRLDQAHSVISGYVLVADLSLPHSSYYRPAIREKCFDGACPIGVIVPASTVGDITALTLTISIDGVQKASRTLKELVRSVEQLLVDVTAFMTLSTGDVLLIGVDYQAPQAKIGSVVTVSAPALGRVQFKLEKHKGETP